MLCYTCLNYALSNLQAYMTIFICKVRIQYDISHVYCNEEKNIIVFMYNMYIPIVVYMSLKPLLNWIQLNWINVNASFVSVNGLILSEGEFSLIIDAWIIRCARSNVLRRSVVKIISIKIFTLKFCKMVDWYTQRRCIDSASICIPIADRMVCSLAKWHSRMVLFYPTIYLWKYWPVLYS